MAAFGGDGTGGRSVVTGPDGGDVDRHPVPRPECTTYLRLTCFMTRFTPGKRTVGTEVEHSLEGQWRTRADKKFLVLEMSLR